MRIYKLTDKIAYKLGEELKVKVSPLSLEAKAEIHSHMLKGSKGDVKELMQGSISVIRHGLKEVEGLTDSSGQPYKLEFENGMLTQQCVEDLLNMEQSTALVQLCSAFVAGIPKQLPEGVSLVEDNEVKK